MKIILKTTFLSILLIASFTAVKAATITWLGGNAAWDDASQWDTGTVPSYGDDVIIPTGYVKIYNGDNEGATSVEVQSSGRLYIYNGGQLEIQGAVDNDGLHNMGRVYIWGYLAINDITQTNSVFSANAIKNDYFIYTYSSSVINIKYIDDDAIHNTITNSYFRVRGGLYMYGIDKRAIYNQDRFYNSGTIDISNSGEPSSFLIVNSDHLRNYNGGVINLDSDIYGGISNSSTNANFRNYGDINIENVSIGVNNHGTMTNYDGSFIESKNNNSTSYYNRQNATITNYGQLKSRDSDSGFYNYGTLINHQAISVFYGFGNGALRNFSSGTIENYFDIYLNSSSSKDIDNDGNITNHNGGIIEINKSIDLSSGGSISNYGFFVSHGSFSHTINGSFGNKGVIDDNQGILQGLFPNDRVIVAPVPGPMQVGVPYPNVLDVVSLSGLNIGDWKISPTGALAGTYDETTNVFTPNASAVGITTIYIAIEDLASGFNRNFSLEIGSPILPLKGSNKISSTRSELANESLNLENAEVKVFPNPSGGQIQLESKALGMNKIQVQIFNAMGQLVQQERLNAGSTSQSIEFSSQLTNGIYIIRSIRNGKTIDSDRIHLQR